MDYSTDEVTCPRCCGTTATTAGAGVECAHCGDPIAHDAAGCVRCMTQVADRFLDAYAQARHKAALALDGSNLDDEDYEGWNDVAERNHCGTCQVNEVVARIEAALAPYLTLLERAAGIEQSFGGWQPAKEEAQDAVRPEVH